MENRFSTAVNHFVFLVFHKALEIFIFPGIWFFLSFPDCEAINFQHAQSFAKGPGKALETCWSFARVPSISGCSQDIEGP